MIKYTEDNIKSLDWKEHIRMRPGMYIGKLGDGTHSDDGIYVLIKEIIDNSIDEYVMGYGKRIDVALKDNKVEVRDYGRGIPLGKVKECVSKINTGAKYDSEVFKKTVGLNGVGTKAVNALSDYFCVQAIRNNETKIVEYSKGNLISEKDDTIEDRDGTKITFSPDGSVFQNFSFRKEYIEKLLWNYAFLNAGLRLYFNNEKIVSENGLKDLLQHNINGDIIYPIMHLKGDDIEAAITHASHNYNEEYYSFVNGQYTPLGGTHLSSFKECYVQTIRNFYKKNFDPSDTRNSIVAAISIKIQEPVFESQTKTKLGSTHIEPNGQTIRSFINDFLQVKLDNYLHKNPDTAEAILQKIQQSEKERTALKGIKKLAKERAKKANLHNKKLRDCKVHYNTKHKDADQSMIFITEGDSASGSITKSRNVNTQAVFSLKGKPLQTFGLTKKVIYENEEFNLIQHALDIENGIENLRYNKIIIATDADVDGLHIQVLLITFFIQFFPDLIKNEHLFILQTPLFRVRNKKETFYCYNDKEKKDAIKKLGKTAEITRFKGLGEISPDEFKHFIGKDIRLITIQLKHQDHISKMLSYYMGKNTMDRQKFIIENLRTDAID